MNERKIATLFGMAALALAITAATARAETEVKVALPFPNGVAWPHLAVAEELGYFKQEGLKVTVVSLNGAAASYKAMATGQAEFAFTGPAQVLNGLAIDEKTVAVYNSYQGHVYQFATPADSPYKRIADLKGQKIGISTVAGGQYPYLLATLKAAGLTVGPGKDVEIAEIGRGGAAAVALQQKRVAAYSASFVDMMTIELRGTKLHRYSEGPTANFISDSLVMPRAALEKNRAAAIGLGRAIAKATVFCMANNDACWAIITKHVPETGKNPDFTKPLLKYTLELHRLKPEAQGRWGYQSPAAWKDIHEFLIESDQLKKRVDIAAGFTNDLIAEMNKFDKAEVEKAAKAYK
jgi:NitT/TauT family transport system substrate-binding protein